LSWGLREPRSRAGKIRVHPRGNLWATGHFMGKKSLAPPSSSLLETGPHASKALGMSPGGPAPHTQYRRLLVQMLQK
ncbi:PREDICTED: neuromedin-B, partial [Myotis davidii]|uniref:neuromedin-B n=1 Tax=Myotis davidii TaxID=225400 RepID=UPI0003EBD3BA